MADFFLSLSDLDPAASNWEVRIVPLNPLIVSDCFCVGWIVWMKEVRLYLNIQKKKFQMVSLPDFGELGVGTWTRDSFYSC